MLTVEALPEGSKLLRYYVSDIKEGTFPPYDLSGVLVPKDNGFCELEGIVDMKHIDKKKMYQDVKQVVKAEGYLGFRITRVKDNLKIVKEFRV